MTDHVWWYVARACGLVAWGLVVASTACGLLLATRRTIRRVTPASALALHRYLSGLAIVFTGIHVLALVADDFVDFGVADVLVPLVSPWRPLAVAAGVVGLYLLVVIEATSVLRNRLPTRGWHAVHLSSYALFALTTLHLLTAGTDTGDLVPETVAVVVGAAATFVAVVLLVWRSAPRASGPRRKWRGQRSVA
jgi:DMSO/TMAO reductase YedYZ heme-binding membrane subunit